MKAINHHLNDATLMAYAAGTTPENMNLAIASHLSMCAQCQNRLHHMEAIGAEALEDTMPMSMGEEALSRILSILDEDFDNLTPEPANQPKKSEFPNPLADFLPEKISDIDWKVLAPGIKHFPLEGVKSSKGTLRLLKISPGVTIPEHSHHGSELTLVLKGSFSDEVGCFKAGDIADIDDETNHQPIADSDEDCICLIATEGPLRFKTMMPKIMQYFTGM